MRRSNLQVLLILLLTMATTSLYGQGVIRKCIICHQKPDLVKELPSGIPVSVTVDRKELRESVHGNLKCQDCHTDVTVIPHKDIVIGKVNCSRCHFNGNNMGIPDSPMYDQFWNSIHGQKAKAGDPKAPHCQDCHGGHNVQPPANPDSHVNKANIPHTCGKCHEKVLDKYSDSVHGKAILEKGILNVPVCTDCHGKHDVYSSDMSVSHTNVQNVPDTCMACHEDYALMKKFNLSTDQAETYTQSFHGVALQYGEERVANCASCHGTHEIRAQDDPKSSINPANIPHTCGKCHKGANENFAKGKIHLNYHKKEAGLAYYVANFFIWLTSLTMVALFIHILLDLLRKLKERRDHLTHKEDDR